MPELPEVETVKRTLENFILNKKIEDIKKISGIKDAAFNKIKELICV